MIRSFALFGVLWMNLHEHASPAMAPGIIDKLPTAPVDEVIGYGANWLMQGTDQALF